MSDWGSTSRISARVTLADGAVLEGELHLASRPSYPPGPETPIEMLNRADPFFALIPREGGVVFLPKAGVSVVACPEPSPWICLLYTSDAADERSSVDLGGRR